MSYSYDTLEQILELAAYRLPVKTLRSLIDRVESVITENKDSYELEREIQKLISSNDNSSGIFSLRKLQEKEQGAAKRIGSAVA